MDRALAAFVFSYLLVTALPERAAAADGVIEINQTCALSGGCLAGDAPGFPVTLAAFGNYVLTSDLDIRTQPEPANLDVLQLSRHVTVDLNGFGLYGPCTNLSPTSCSSRGSGMGVRPTAPSPVGLVNVRLHGGRIVGMGSNAVWLGANARVEDLQVENNGVGVVVGGRSLVRGSSVVDNQGLGVRLGDASIASDNAIVLNQGEGILCDGDCALHDNMMSRNVLAAVSGGGARATGGNVCDDDQCPRENRLRRFYLKNEGLRGDEPDEACRSGFRMAALYEIFDPSNLEYAPFSDAYQLADAGGPPTFAAGWVKTGWSSSEVELPGIGNCSAWSSTTGFGSIAFLRNDWSGTDGNGADLTPWSVSEFSCSNTGPGVWCIEE